MSKLLIFILVIAFLVRFVGIGYGLPNEFISDEFLMVAVSLKMLDASSLRPYFGNIFYHQPLSAYISLIGISAYLSWEMLSHKFSSLSEISSYYLTNARELIIVPRFLAVIFGVGTVYLLYLLGRDFFNKRVGLIAAFFATFDLLLVEINHTGRVWSFFVFFITLALYASFRVTQRENLKDYIYSALASSLALFTLLPGVLTFFSSLIPKISLKNLSLNQKFLGVGKKFWSAFGILFLTLVLSIILNPRGLGVAFLRFNLNVPLLSNFVLQTQSTPSGTIGAMRVDWVSKFADPFITLFNYTPVYFLLFFVGLFILWKEDRKKFLVLSSFPFAYYLFIGPLFSYGNVERALTPFAPYIILVAAFTAGKIFDKIYKKIFSLFLIFVFSLYSILISTLFDIKITRVDTRVMAQEWFSQNVSENEKNDYYTRYGWGNESVDQFDAVEKEFKSKKLIVQFSPIHGPSKLKNNYFNNIQNPFKVLSLVDRFGPVIEIYKVTR